MVPHNPTFEKEIAFEMREDLLRSRIPFDSGSLHLKLGNRGNSKKLIDVQWMLCFNNRNDGERYVDLVKKIFNPVSVHHEFGTEEELEFSQYAHFSSPARNGHGVRDIILMFFKRSNSEIFEFRIHSVRIA